MARVNSPGATNVEQKLGRAEHVNYRLDGTGGGNPLTFRLFTLIRDSKP
jgi:hypothetical protein